MPALSFSIEGEFITKLARDAFFNENKFEYAMNLLTQCLQSPEIPQEESYILAFKVLNGDLKIKGTYPGDDYGITPDESNTKTVAQHITKMAQIIKQQKEEIQELSAELAKYPQKETPSSHMIEEYLDYQHKLDKQDKEFSPYGLLSPTGEFTAIKWGEHENQARIIADKYEDVPHDYRKKCWDALTWLINNKRYILIHNPANSTPITTIGPTNRATTQQKNFLWDFYTKLGYNELAQQSMEL